MKTNCTQHSTSNAGASTRSYTTKDIRRFADFLFGFLDIPPVNIELITKEQMCNVPGSVPNTEACLSTIYNGDEVVQQYIYVVRKRQYTVLDLAKLSHEIRHYWQYCTAPEYYFEGYSGEMTEEEYNRHPSEIDANAFAVLAIENTIGIKGSRNYRSDPVAQQLFDERYKKLVEEYC